MRIAAVRIDFCVGGIQLQSRREMQLAPQLIEQLNGNLRTRA
jgi:hypothetical protein